MMRGPIGLSTAPHAGAPLLELASAFGDLVFNFLPGQKRLA
jgi:hypothetical protein